MDFVEYNEQALSWQTLKPKTPLPKLVYTVAHADVVNYAIHAVEDPDEWYISHSPLGGAIIPPAFFYDEYIKLVVAANIPMGVLNAKMAYQNKHFAFHGQEITVKGFFERSYKSRGRPYMELSVTILNEAGKELCAGLITMLLSMEKEE
jgi:hypothetical protein